MARRTVTARRTPLLAALVSFFLIVLALLPAAATRHTATGQGDAVVAAVSDVAVAARNLSERLSPAHRSQQHRFGSPTAALPAALLVGLLLLTRVRRNRGIAVAVRPQLLVAAGRGPPVTS